MIMRTLVFVSRRQPASFLWVSILLALLAGAPAAWAQDKGFRMIQDDFPFQAACIGANFPSNNVALKGYAIRVGTNAAVLWDTDTLRLAAGWTGGFINT